MQLEGIGIAGTMESGDIFVEIEQAQTPGIMIELSSTVANQYGRQIKAVITEALASCGVTNVRVKAVDKGALDCTIFARVTAAAYRGANRNDIPWE